MNSTHTDIESVSGPEFIGRLSSPDVHGLLEDEGKPPSPRHIVVKSVSRVYFGWREVSGGLQLVDPSVLDVSVGPLKRAA